MATVTGYTAGVIDGTITSLQGYAERCAAAFLFCMRDSNSNQLPDEVPYSKYYECRLAQAEAEHARLASMTTDQKEAGWRTFMADQEQCLRDRLAENAAENERHARMRAEVLAWEAPSHFGKLKEFMLQQLDVSRCSSQDDIRRFYALPKLSRDEWHAKALADVAKDVERYREEHQKEVAKAQRETQFIRDLRACF